LLFSGDASFQATVSVDAVLKCGRFAAAGKGGNLAPDPHQFFNDVEKGVGELDKHGR